METIATVTQVLPMESGTSKAGNEYRRLTVIAQYGERYPKTMALSLMNERCDTFAPMLTPGSQLKFHFDVSSREYNGRWYTECMVWKVEQIGAAPQQAQPWQQPQPQPTYQQPQPYQPPQATYDQQPRYQTQWPQQPQANDTIF